MDKKKLIIIIVGLLVVLGAGYKFACSGPAPKAPKPKVVGVILPMQPEFMINLEGGRFAKVTIALLLSEKDPAAAAGEGEAAAGPPPPHPQNSVIRSIITAQLTGASPDELLDRGSRAQLMKEIKEQLEKQTDAKVEKVIVTDITVD